jgi:hypothetical protein
MTGLYLSRGGIQGRWNKNQSLDGYRRYRLTFLAILFLLAELFGLLKAFIAAIVICSAPFYDIISANLGYSAGLRQGSRVACMNCVAPVPAAEVN